MPSTSGKLLNELYFLNPNILRNKPEELKGFPGIWRTTEKLINFVHGSLACTKCQRVFHTPFGLSQHCRKIHLEDRVLDLSSAEMWGRPKRRIVARRSAKKKEPSVEISVNEDDPEVIILSDDEEEEEEEEDYDRQMKQVQDFQNCRVDLVDVVTRPGLIQTLEDQHGVKIHVHDRAQLDDEMELVDLSDDDKDDDDDVNVDRGVQEELRRFKEVMIVGHDPDKVQRQLDNLLAKIKEAEKEEEEDEPLVPQVRKASFQCKDVKKKDSVVESIEEDNVICLD